MIIDFRHIGPEAAITALIAILGAVSWMTAVYCELRAMRKAGGQNKKEHGILWRLGRWNKRRIDGHDERLDVHDKRLADHDELLEGRD